MRGDGSKLYVRLINMVEKSVRLGRVEPGRVTEFAVTQNRD